MTWPQSAQPGQSSPFGSGDDDEYMASWIASETTQTAPAPRPHMRDRLLSLTGLGALQPVRPLVDGLLYRGTLAQLSGPPGSYKSFVAVGMACAVALGRPFEGHRVPEAGRVVYVAAEGGGGIRTRVLAWCENNQVDPADLEGQLFVLPEPMQLGNSVDVSQARDVARELQPALFVADTRARCTLGLSENDSADQGTAIEAAESIQRAGGGAFLAVHHSGRVGDHGRGSNAWDGAVWSDLRLKGADLRCELRVAKHKDAPDGIDYRYRMLPHIVLERALPQLEDERPDEWASRRSTLVVAQDRPLEFSDPARRSSQIVLEIVRNSTDPQGFTRTQIVDAAKLLKVGSSSAYSAIDTLSKAGKIRKSGTRFIVPGLSLLPPDPL